MGSNSLHSSVNSVVILDCGFVGGVLISAMIAIRDSKKESIFLKYPNKSYLNVRASKNARVEGIMDKMEINSV